MNLKNCTIIPYRSTTGTLPINFVASHHAHMDMHAYKYTLGTKDNPIEVLHMHEGVCVACYNLHGTYYCNKPHVYIMDGKNSN